MYLVTLQNIPSKLPYLRHFMSWGTVGINFKVLGWMPIQPYLNPKRPGYWVWLAAAFFERERKSTGTL